LQNLAKGIDELDKTYEQAMERIEDHGRENRDLAKQILAWIVYARRPLSTLELQHALAIRPHMTKLDEDYLPSVNLLRSLCVGLVTIDEESDIIRLVHYTTQEYFQRTQKLWFPNAESKIATSCVTYLSFRVFDSGFCRTDTEFEDRLRSNPLYDYAAQYWGYHAGAASAEVQLITQLLESEAKVSSCSQAMMASRNYSGYSQRVPLRMTGLHLAAYFGLREAMIVLLRN
jgi:hypothetical protein